MHTCARPFGADPEPILFDVESRSRAELSGKRSIGGRKYWQHHSTEVLCICWFDARDGTRGVWAPLLGGPPPDWTGRAVAAHNLMTFDRWALARVGIPHGELIDTMELARRNGLPGKLDELARRWLGARKDKASSKFTTALSTIRRPSKRTAHLAPCGVIAADEWKQLSREDQRELGYMPEITPAVLERVITYCQSDVDILERTWPRLAPWLGITELEREVSRVERVINDRGLPVDVPLARRLLEEDARNRELALETAAEELDDAGTVAPDGFPWSAEDVRKVANSPAQFTEFTGAPNAQASTVDELAKGAGPGAILARARQALASIAKGKLEAVLRLEINGRLYDAHAYYAAHTGRWGGRGMQTQNLPRPPKELEEMTGEEIAAEAQKVLDGGHCSQDMINVLLRAVIGGNAP